MKEIIEAAEKFALDEIEKYGRPSKINFNISNDKGLELAQKLGVDTDIVQIGTRLMDIKLGEGMKTGGDHVQMGVESTKEFLSKFDIPEETKEKISLAEDKKQRMMREHEIVQKDIETRDVNKIIDEIKDNIKETLNVELSVL